MFTLAQLIARNIEVTFEYNKLNMIVYKLMFIEFLNSSSYLFR